MRQRMSHIYCNIEFSPFIDVQGREISVLKRLFLNSCFDETFSLRSLSELMLWSSISCSRTELKHFF